MVCVLEELYEQRCKRGGIALRTATSFRKAAVVVALVNFIRMVVPCETFSEIEMFVKRLHLLW